MRIGFNYIVLFFRCVLLLCSFLVILLVFGCLMVIIIVKKSMFFGIVQMMCDLMVVLFMGFMVVVDVVVCDCDMIFEQINGGSVSYLENGLQEVIFGIYFYVLDELLVLDMEVYCFVKLEGIVSQYCQLYGDEGKFWKVVIFGIVYEYGVEFKVDCMLV